MLSHKFAECRCADPSDCRTYLRDSAAGLRQLQCCSRTQLALSRSGLHSQASARCTRGFQGSSSAVVWHHAHTLLTPWKASLEAPVRTIGSRCLYSLLALCCLGSYFMSCRTSMLANSKQHTDSTHHKKAQCSTDFAAAGVQKARLCYADGVHMQGYCHAYGCTWVLS